MDNTTIISFIRERLYLFLIIKLIERNALIEDKINNMLTYLPARNDLYRLTQLSLRLVLANLGLIVIRDLYSWLYIGDNHNRSKTETLSLPQPNRR